MQLIITHVHEQRIQVFLPCRVRSSYLLSSLSVDLRGTGTVAGFATVCTGRILRLNVHVFAHVM